MTVRSMISKHGKTLTIQTKSAGTLDSSGGRIESWGTSTGATGFVQVRSVSDDLAGGAERSIRRATIYFNGKPSISVSDRIAYDSTTWEVSSVRVPQERSVSDSLCFTIIEAAEVFG
jgi:head-tail adaptor